MVDFVQNAVPSDETGRLQIFWNYLQNTVNNQQFYTKYGTLFAASAYQNTLEKADAVARNNATANVDYVTVTYPFAPDSTVTVSSAEIKKFYNDHKSFFQQRANRDIEYVVFEVVPSAADIALANEKINEVYDEFATTDNMKAFLLRNSDRQLSDYWYRSGELNTINTDINNFVFDGNPTGASPVYSDRDNIFYTARVMESAQIADSAYVKHILLPAGSKDRADSLVAVIKKGGDFAALAAQFSSDQGSAADGQLGNIGWMTQTYLIPGFESVITAKVGEPYVVNTQYGTHVVLVSAKTAPMLKKKVAILEKASIASKETFNTFYSHSLNVNEATSAYGGVDQAKEGKSSDIITVNNNYFFIAAVKDVHKEGTADLREVADAIRQQLYTRKLAEARTADVAGKIAGKTSLEDMAEALGVNVVNEPSMSFSTTGARLLDPALVGAAYATPAGQVSGPVSGSYATYIVRVNSREDGDFFTEQDAANLALQKAQYSSQLILPVMSQIGDIKDNRARFF